MNRQVESRALAALLVLSGILHAGGADAGIVGEVRTGATAAFTLTAKADRIIHLKDGCVVS